MSELVLEKEALVLQHGDLEAARAEREERLRVLEGVLQQVSWGIRWVGAGGIKEEREAASGRGSCQVGVGGMKWEGGIEWERKVLREPGRK